MLARLSVLIVEVPTRASVPQAMWGTESFVQMWTNVPERTRAQTVPGVLIHRERSDVQISKVSYNNHYYTHPHPCVFASAIVLLIRFRP